MPQRASTQSRLAAAIAAAATLVVAPATACLNASAPNGPAVPCSPDNQRCGQKFDPGSSPQYHLQDQHGCNENDPNGPVFDPVHGVIHQFYQIHLAAYPGHGPDYGHFVSKDFIHWAQLPVAIWNGVDSSVIPFKKTPYDDQAIYTGSAAIVDGAGPGGKGRGIIQIYPGLCIQSDWKNCETGTLLAQAVPADYAGDPLLTNWSKAPFNPILENTERDPSSPWKTPSGEWRLRTVDSKVYGSASDADVIAGKWYEIGVSPDFRPCECPSVYPLPAATPGFEAAYAAAAQEGALPTHVHKTSCGGDYWQLGTYAMGPPKALGNFTATPGWEDLFEQRKMDSGGFYASKDNVYPTKAGGKRRLNWGWVTADDRGAQSLPREITFNAAARYLQQYPISELAALRNASVCSQKGLEIKANVSLDLGVAPEAAVQSEALFSFELPKTAANFGFAVGEATWGPYAEGVMCTVNYEPPSNASALFHDLKFSCNVDEALVAHLRLLTSETSVEIRVFADRTFLEVFVQRGRVAMTVPVHELYKTTKSLALVASTDMVADAEVWPLKGIFVSIDEVRSAPRMYR
eukprot:g1660.t1